MTAITRPRRTTIILFLLFTLYAVLRYHVFKGEPWRRFPLWTLNKVAAMTSVTLLAMALVKGVRKRSAQEILDAASLGRLGFSLALGHVIASLALFGPAEYPRFFEAAGGSTFSTSVAVAAGVIAILVLWPLAVGSNEANASRSLRGQVRLALLATVAHSVGLGWFVWIDPATWPGGLVPLTLIAAVIATGSCVASYARGRSASDGLKPLPSSSGRSRVESPLAMPSHRLDAAPTESGAKG
jgi:DMSO/TMAO reductase YedYZ heme-binding membrane subunit